MSEPQPARRFKVQTVEDVTVAFFLGRRIVDEEDIEATFGQLQRLADNSEAGKVVLNFRKVEFLSSAVLGRLVKLHKTLQSTGGRLILCRIAPMIFEVFKLTRLDKVLNIKPDTGEALRALGVRARDGEGELEE
jgi:anti-sigma B factor antagonist